MKALSKIKLSLLLIFLMFLLPYIITSSKAHTKKNMKEETTNNNNSVVYILKSDENNVFLYANGRIHKKYDINPMLLPAQDIISLANGIKVTSIEEADSLAEDFDG